MTWLDVFHEDSSEEADGESPEARRRRERDEAQARADQEWYDHQRRITAEHEAGHHAVASALGVRGSHARINDDLSGYGGGGWADGDTWSGFNDAVIALAGAKACGSHEGAEDDWALAKASLRDSDRSWAEAQREADRLVSANWGRIKRDADTLFEGGWI